MVPHNIYNVFQFLHLNTKFTCVQIMIKNKQACICIDSNLTHIQIPTVSGLHNNQSQ